MGGRLSRAVGDERLQPLLDALGGQPGGVQDVPHLAAPQRGVHRVDGAVQPVAGPALVLGPDLHPLLVQAGGRHAQLARDTQHAVLVGQGRAPGGHGPELPEEVVVRPVELLLAAAGEERQVRGGVVGRRQLRQGVEDETGGDPEQLPVERTAVQEVLPVLVRLPRGVEDAGQRDLVLGGEEGPEGSLARGHGVQTVAHRVLRHGPGDVQLRPVVQLAGAVGDLARGRVLGGEDPPPFGGLLGAPRHLLEDTVDPVGVDRDLAAGRGHGPLVVQEHLPDVRGEELEARGERLGRVAVRAPVPADVVTQALGGARHQRQPDDGGGPGQQLVQHRVVGPFLVDVERPGHTEDRGLHAQVGRRVETEGVGDLGGGPVPVEAEAEGAVAAEELGGVADGEHRLHPDAEAADLPAALARDAHPQDGLRALRRHRGALVRAVQVVLGEDDVQLAAGRVGDLVGGVLHEFEQLPLAVPALGDATFTVGVLLHQPRVDLVGPQDGLGLPQHGLDHGRDGGVGELPVGHESTCLWEEGRNRGRAGGGRRGAGAYDAGTPDRRASA
ncbi:hypothetical protein M2168_003876 [Streptomyces sp. CZ24]|nr:hypothetical protein [Streptomyces sp. CZ24]